MLCDDCGRREAVVHIMQIGPDGRTEKNLCEECAAGYGDFMVGHNQEQPRKKVSVNDFLRGMFSQPQEMEPEQREQPASQPQELTCPNCGMTYQDFAKTGKIGCSVCYETFRRQLEPLLRRIHGTSTHSGKIPHRSGGTLELKHEISVLRGQLKESVAQEEYEQAAQLRDRIRALEKDLSEKEGGDLHD